MSGENLIVDWFFTQPDKWQTEYIKMREIALGCNLTEELKWGKPCYSYEKNNIIIIQGFKNYCALLFVKGVLLKDEARILIAMTENVQSARQIRFTSADQIDEMRHIVKAYILEAVEVEKAGLKVEFKAPSEFKMADEFRARLDADPALKVAFEALTPGRQRAYLLNFAQPKQSATRTARVEKYIPQILAGKGLND
jgi:uncharacterized protein YdeI (YjbR/CyaY-like superfamily)